MVRQSIKNRLPSLNSEESDHGEEIHQERVYQEEESDLIEQPELTCDEDISHLEKDKHMIEQNYVSQGTQGSQPNDYAYSPSTNNLV